jgi:outer membrane murein-binding lipoprotein Lpp
MRRILNIAVVLCVLLLAGCATKTRSDALTTTLNAYGSTLRWGDFQSAAQFIEPAQRAAHPLNPLDLARYQQVRVSEYDNGAGPVPTGDFDVQQTVLINLVNIHTQSERSIVDHQTWHYDEKTKRWWLTSGLPDITQN